MRVKMTELVPIERIASKIYLIRGVKVILDRDLAELYNVETKRLKEQVRRNIERFPEDCIFRAIPAADSGRSRPPIPIDSGH